MKSKHLTIIGILGLASLPAYGSAECDALGKEVKAQINSEPKKILVVVDAAISKNASCACEIVSAAISVVPDDNEMIREIVITAVGAAPDEAPRIAECAIASAPEASTEIAAGLDEVFEGATAESSAKQPISAKSSEEVVVEEAEIVPTQTVTVAGIYLIAPGGASSIVVEQDSDKPDDEIVKDTTKRPKRKSNPPSQTATDPD